MLFFTQVAITGLSFYLFDCCARTIWTSVQETTWTSVQETIWTSVQETTCINLTKTYYGCYNTIWQYSFTTKTINTTIIHSPHHIHLWREKQLQRFVGNSTLCIALLYIPYLLQIFEQYKILQKWKYPKAYLNVQNVFCVFWLEFIHGCPKLDQVNVTIWVNN